MDNVNYVNYVYKIVCGKWLKRDDMSIVFSFKLILLGSTDIQNIYM